MYSNQVEGQQKPYYYKWDVIETFNSTSKETEGKPLVPAFTPLQMNEWGSIRNCFIVRVWTSQILLILNLVPYSFSLHKEIKK